MFLIVFFAQVRVKRPWLCTVIMGAAALCRRPVEMAFTVMPGTLTTPRSDSDSGASLKTNVILPVFEIVSRLWINGVHGRLASLAVRRRQGRQQSQYRLETKA